MSTQNIEFQNTNGQTLSAQLELPNHQQPIAYAIFAHCFTCSKNLGAVRHISRGLTTNGFAVLRFDFTGLGESEGEFAATNFSHNIQDLIDAASFLSTNYEAPKLLIGHSLGGAAVVVAAAQIQSIDAIITIAAPAQPSHVRNLLQEDISKIKNEGEAVVSIDGREFKIQKQFLEDLEKSNPPKILNKMRNKALLILHSPQDKIVEIENAQELYTAAFHPKSFISLDGADHLLSNKQDSFYVGDVVASWVQRYLQQEKKPALRTDQEVVARLYTDDQFTTDIKIGQHTLRADEPTNLGGNDFGPSPYELVAAGLGACTAMTLKMYAARKKWNLKEVQVHLNHAKEPDTEKANRKIDIFERHIEVKGDLDQQQVDKLKEIANKCPVHRTLEAKAVVRTQISFK